MNVDHWRRIVTLEQARALSEVCIEAGLLLREISLVENHPLVRYDNWAYDLRKALVALGEGLQVWADTGKAPEFDTILSIRKLLKLRMDALSAQHRHEES